MKKYHIPTAAYEVFDELDAALLYLKTAPLPTVIKADGLALGKGVIIANTREEANDAVCAMMRDRKFGNSGARVVIEEFLEGPEVSILAFTDGETIVPMVSSMDHKRALDGDKGLNTGGMGTVAPNPYYTPQIAQTCMDEIFAHDSCDEGRRPCVPGLPVFWANAYRQRSACDRIQLPFWRSGGTGGFAVA